MNVRVSLREYLISTSNMKGNAVSITQDTSSIYHLPDALLYVPLLQMLGLSVDPIKVPAVN